MVLLSNSFRLLCWFATFSEPAFGFLNGYVNPCRPARVSRLSAIRMNDLQKVQAVKYEILKIAAATDRGQRMNTLIAPTYQEKKLRMNELALELATFPCKIDETTLSGDWELIYSDVELFRSSPFFLAIEEALDSSPGVPLLGQWLGITDPKKKSSMFFKLHQLQVMSWGVSTVGKISQRIDFQAGHFLSSFDTVIFGLTVIPILGWFKLLPTFGGRVVTLADGLRLEGGQLRMELQKTRVEDAPGVARIPLVGSLFMDRWYPVNQVWKLLPWNGGPWEGRAPVCGVSVEYVDGDLRLSRDCAGAIFVYARPVS